MYTQPLVSYIQCFPYFWFVICVNFFFRFFLSGSLSMMNARSRLNDVYHMWSTNCILLHRLFFSFSLHCICRLQTSSSHVVRHQQRSEYLIYDFFSRCLSDTCMGNIFDAGVCLSCVIFCCCCRSYWWLLMQLVC